MRIRPRLEAVQILLLAALAAFLFILAGQGRMWLNPQPPPGVPDYAWAGPMPSLTDPNGIMAAIARKKQAREMEQIRRYVVAMCREHKTMALADGRGGKVPSVRQTRLLCRQARTEGWK